MPEKQPPYEPVVPVDDIGGREERARAYMARMADYANAGELAKEKIFGLQRPSQGLPAGVPALVLRKDRDGLWEAVEWCEPDVVLEPGVSNTEPVRPDVRPEPGPVRPAKPTDAGFDKKAYQREYMRAKRAREKGAPE